MTVAARVHPWSCLQPYTLATYAASCITWCDVSRHDLCCRIQIKVGEASGADERAFLIIQRLARGETLQTDFADDENNTACSLSLFNCSTNLWIESRCNTTHNLRQCAGPNDPVKCDPSVESTVWGGRVRITQCRKGIAVIGSGERRYPSKWRFIHICGCSPNFPKIPWSFRSGVTNLPFYWIDSSFSLRVLPPLSVLINFWRGLYPAISAESVLRLICIIS